MSIFKEQQVKEEPWYPTVYEYPDGNIFNSIHLAKHQGFDEESSNFMKKKGPAVFFGRAFLLIWVSEISG